jgi:hypothetical protein
MLDCSHIAAQPSGKWFEKKSQQFKVARHRLGCDLDFVS